MNDPQFVHCHLKKVNGSSDFSVTFVYGFPDKQRRKVLWDKLNSLAQSVVEPWVLLGYFNSILFPEEKRGGRPIFQGANYFILLCIICFEGSWV